MPRSRRATRHRLRFAPLLLAALASLLIWGLLAQAPFGAAPGAHTDRGPKIEPGPTVNPGPSIEPVPAQKGSADARGARGEEELPQAEERNLGGVPSVLTPIPEPLPQADGSVSGSLLDCSETGCEGIPVHLSGPAGQLESTHSDHQGRFRYEQLEAGRWILRVGSSLAPWLPELEFEHTGARLELEPLRLPPLASVELRIVDTQGASMPDVRVYSPGEFELRSDAHGHCLVSALPAGSHRFYARDEALGRGNVVFELAPGVRSNATIVLRTSRDH